MTQTQAPIALDLRRDLPKVRKSYAKLVKAIGTCSYSTPCAVGAMMTPAHRRRLERSFDTGTPIDTLIQSGLVSVPDGQAADMLLLQEAFDRDDREAFDAMLGHLEVRYAERVDA